MHTALKITAFAAALAASFGTAYGVGSSFDPVVDGASSASHVTSHAKGAAGGGTEGEGGERRGGAPVAGGLQVSENGYTLDLTTPRVTAGQRADLRFTVRDDAGRAVTDYRPEHGRELHLVLASNDLVTYRHLHPARAADGTWTTPVELPRAGGYRVLADFAPAAGGGGGVMLGADLAVAGDYAPLEPPAPSRTATVDGYEVRLTGVLRPGAAGELGLAVSRDGRPVTDLEPHLGAYGHLVALRSGDLAQLHVHPNGAPGDGATRPGPRVSFTATAPSAGTYRLFLDFRHGGKVRTAAFTVRAEAPRNAEGAPADGARTEGHGH
ncbi:hypothetical protein [Streptomyces sp. SHP 1-2]|uniref:hypothetical protein n=1 Tax=Streptomyces sp. SHP 1-2 TaxID=2769489 RepID=UPI002238C26B|nr:hypothetical protein [Streptomyces sp. SHP 1-2]MCW5252136.1 hypothetical protein [Streptomyces sp. SHP 1-2]